MNHEAIPITPKSTRSTRSDEFLSQDDLDLKNLSEAELAGWWNAWLEAAQATNDQDQFDYSHGVFRREPPSL